MKKNLDNKNRNNLTHIDILKFVILEEKYKEVLLSKNAYKPTKKLLKKGVKIFYNDIKKLKIVLKILMCPEIFHKSKKEYLLLTQKNYNEVMEDLNQIKELFDLALSYDEDLKLKEKEDKIKKSEQNKNNS